MHFCKTTSVIQNAKELQDTILARAQLLDFDPEGKQLLDVDKKLGK